MRRLSFPIIFIVVTEIEEGSTPNNLNIKLINLHLLKHNITFHDNGCRMASLYSLYGIGSDRCFSFLRAPVMT